MKSDRSAKTVNEAAQQQLFEDGAREEELVRALQECQAMIDSGKAINREELLQKYPEIHDELSACFEGLELMNEFKTRDTNTPTEQSKLVARDQLAPSATLGDFRLERELGRGGMGVVYEAEQLSIGRRVALKVLPYAAMLDKRQVARFQNEARAAATLEHPHIVPVYFVGNDRGVYYYAMRLIEGKNLSEILRDLREKPENSLPVSSLSTQAVERHSRNTNVGSRSTEGNAESTVIHKGVESRTVTSPSVSKRVYYDSVAKIAMQGAKALDFAHTHGIVHRDIKPANIMLDDLGDAWVTDFGLARIETDGDVTMTGDLVGTIRYMSPEQTLAKRVVVDHRSDVYSLGATLYELLTHKPAFDGEDRAELLKKIAFEEPRPPSRIDPRVPADLETIVLKALQKKPEDRYGNAQEMATDLERYLSRQPIQARRTSLARRFNMWRTRHPLAVSTIALSIVVLAMLTIGAPFLWMQRAAREQAEQLASQAQSLADANAARAATQEYYASVSEVRELNVIRPVGWTWDALERIEKVAQLDADGKDLLQLRSLTANALTATDVQLLQEFAEGIDPGAVAASPDGKLFAIGEVRPAPGANVAHIYVFKSEQSLERVSLLRTLDLPTEGGLLGTIVQRVSGGPEGVRSLCFSNTTNRLAVGTRYGQILEWDLGGNAPPREISAARSDENERVNRLQYSPDDQFCVACIGGVNELRVIDLTSPEFPVWSHPQKRESFAFAKGGKLLFQNAKGVVLEIEDLANPQPRKKVINNSVADINGFAANWLGDCGVVGDWSSLGPLVSFVDLQCLKKSKRIDVSPSTSESAYSYLVFGPFDQAVIGVKGNQIRTWDGLSGSKIFDLPKPDTIYVKHTVADLTGRWLIAGSSGSQLYRWRHPVKLTDSKIQQVSQSAVLKTFSQGAWPIEAFDLSQDGERIAIVESNAGGRDQVRVRSFALHNGLEEGRWTLCGKTERRYPLRSRGTDVLYTHGGNIIAACKEVGVPMVLGKHGIQFPSGTARPMLTAEGRPNDQGKTVFDFPIPPPVSSPYERLAIGIAMRFTTGQSKELEIAGLRVRMDVFVDGEMAVSRELDLEPYMAIGADGWHSQLVASLEKTNKPVRLEVSISNSDAAGSVRLEPGAAHLMATLGDNAPHYWLGPYATQGNGKIVSAEDGNTLTSRDTSLSAPDWKWTDTLNAFATIRALDAAETSTVLGTRWGHVYWVDAQRKVKQLNTIGKSHGGDVKEEVAGVAIDKLGRLAASVSREGRVALYRLNSQGIQQEERELPTHSSSISCIALHRDGDLIAAGAESGKLRIWRQSNTRFELWFEVAFDRPIEDLQFSPANEQLFILCRSERGVRILDLDAIRQEFEVLGIADSW